MYLRRSRRLQNHAKQSIPTTLDTELKQANFLISTNSKSDETETKGKTKKNANSKEYACARRSVRRLVVNEPSPQPSMQIIRDNRRSSRHSTPDNVSSHISRQDDTDQLVSWKQDSKYAQRHNVKMLSTKQQSRKLSKFATHDDDHESPHRSSLQKSKSRSSQLKKKMTLGPSTPSELSCLRINAHFPLSSTPMSNEDSNVRMLND